jgi:signal transduction histidine kinase
MPLVAVEVSCRARGDERCRFVMAPPHTIAGHLARLAAEGQPVSAAVGSLEVPEFFRRKRLEDQLRRARDELELRVVQRTEELKQRNEQLRRANARIAGAYRAREEFLAMISHELRTPLVTGLGYVELLLAGKLGELSSSADGAMRVAFRNLQRLTGLVEDILRYQQLVHPVGPAPALLPLDPASLCTEALDGFLVRTGRDMASVTLDVSRGLPPVLGDGDMLRQVLGNLLDNAHKHAGSATALWVRAHTEESDGVRFVVEDAGPGVPPDLLARITEPFVRQSRETPGLGLGLAIVDQLLRAHGSALVAESTLGRGSRFSFALRQAAQLEAEAQLPKRRRRRRTSSLVGVGVHVLVVEDDADTREFVALVLRQEGCRVTTVATAEEALVALDRPAVDAVLADQGLPGMSGTELCATLRERGGDATPWFVLFTAHADEATRHECVESGCDDLLTKPVSVAALRDFARTARQRCRGRG